MSINQIQSPYLWQVEARKEHQTIKEATTLLEITRDIRLREPEK